jgi:hypothetical protein
MMKSWRLVLLLILVLGMFGCHRRLKEFAREAEAVTVQVNVSGRPSVDLVEEGPAPDNLAGAMGQAAVNVAATKKSIDTQRRIERLIAPEHILGLAADGVQSELSGGYPFGMTDGQGDGYMQFNLIDYGIVQSGGGPAFFANYNMVIYRNSDNKRVYRNNINCYDNEFYVPNTMLNLAGTIATIEYLESLSDEELMVRIEAALDRCISRSFRELRRHAS